MGKRNNFISIIALGNFNPAILTPSFLVEKCGFKVDGKPKGQTNPVVSSLEFDNITFLMELEKFQILEKNPSSFAESNIIKLMRNYLEVLSFTPVYVMGVNFNLDFEVAPKDVIERLVDKQKLLEIFNTEELLYNTKQVISKESTNFVSWDMTKKSTPIFRLTVKHKDGIFCANYNVEMRDIEADRKKMNYIDDNFSVIISEIEGFSGKLFGGS